jgi:hypothetical protein
MHFLLMMWWNNCTFVLLLTHVISLHARAATPQLNKSESALPPRAHILCPLHYTHTHQLELSQMCTNTMRRACISSNSIRHFSRTIFHPAHVHIQYTPVDCNLCVCVRYTHIKVVKTCTYMRSHNPIQWRNSIWGFTCVLFNPLS